MLVFCVLKFVYSIRHVHSVPRLEVLKHVSVEMCVFILHNHVLVR